MCYRLIINTPPEKESRESKREEGRDTFSLQPVIVNTPETRDIFSNSIIRRSAFKRLYFKTVRAPIKMPFRTTKRKPLMNSEIVSISRNH